MANDWTRLLQEASKRGGPTAMKAYYANRGRFEGAGGVALVAAGLVLLNKARLSFTEARKASVPQPPKDDAAPPQGEEEVPGDGTLEAPEREEAGKP